MTVSSILNLLDKLNKSILCKPLASIISFYSTSLINLVMNKVMTKKDIEISVKRQTN